MWKKLTWVKGFQNRIFRKIDIGKVVPCERGFWLLLTPCNTLRLYCLRNFGLDVDFHLIMCENRWQGLILKSIEKYKISKQIYNYFYHILVKQLSVCGLYGICWFWHPQTLFSFLSILTFKSFRSYSCNSKMNFTLNLPLPVYVVTFL